MRKSNPRYMGEETDEAFHAKVMQILLDGRTQEELMKQIRSAYPRLGIK